MVYPRAMNIQSMARGMRIDALSSVLLILSVVSLVSSNCYCVSNNQVFDCSGTEKPCGNASSVDAGAQLCCVGNDQCGADSICHFTEQIANTTGYYLGGCTDPTYSDPVCQRHCTDSTTSDIVYNSNTQLWSCCGHSNGDVLCQDPESDATFQAIPLSDFPGTSSAVTTSTSTSAFSSSTSPLTSPPSSTFTSSSVATGASSGALGTGSGSASQNSSSGLSAGAIAGIAISVVLVGLAIIAGLAFIIIRRRRVAADTDAAATANIPGYFDAPGYSGAIPHFQREGVAEIYNPEQEQGIGINGLHDPGKPEMLHESDSRPIPAQLYGSQPQVSELP